MGVQGDVVPMAGGRGGCPPHKFQKGRAANPCNQATSGTQNAGKPKANEGGKTGVEGAEPPPRGQGGCAPKIFKEGASS